jgi:uncharacterized protein (TIGR03435 family)
MIFGKIAMVLTAVAAVTAQQINGQSAQPTTIPAVPLTFEVASIKPVPPPLPTGGGPWIASRGRFRAEVAQVRGVIAMAYRVLPAQVEGGPDWIDREPYFFDARAENPDAGPDQIRAMVQTLLADRFKLAVRRDTRQSNVYRLIVGRNGSKLKDANGGRRNYLNWTGPGQVTFTEMTSLVSLSAILASFLGAPVLDETGLKGTYNYSLEFADPRLANSREPRLGEADSRPDLFTAVQEQLGLQLQSAKRAIEFVVIDHVERPSAN